MIPGCTSAIDITLDDTTIDLHNAEDVFVTINQNGEVLTFSGDRVEIGDDGFTLTVYLSQQETLKFRYGPATCVVNWIYLNLLGGISRASTDPFILDVGEQTYRQVLT